MSEIKRFDIPRNGRECMHEDPDGEYVQYDDHLAEMFRMRAEVERLTAERDNAQDGDDVALSALTSALRERDAAQAEVERLQNSANLWQHDAQQLALTVDGLKRELHEIRPEAHLLRAEVRGLIRERNEVRNAARIEATQLRAEVERLTEESEQRRVANHRIMVERNEAREQVYRLQQACGDKVANGQDMRDTSRPTDEDIWREGFMVMLRKTSYAWERSSEEADRVLTIYRARWPR